MTREASRRLPIDLGSFEDEAEGDPAICIAVLDGPADLTHPCFDGASLACLEEVAPCAPGAGPSTEHGTHVASLIFGQPGALIEGIAPRCRGLVVPIFHDREDGTLERATQAELARAIFTAVHAGAMIINISAGEPLTDDSVDLRLVEALGFAERSGVLVIAAAGNSGCACEEVPAAMETVLVVGAAEPDASPAWMSNWGARYRDRGLLAPGIDIRGATPSGGARTRSGTSYAAPIVAGVAALLMTLQRRLGLEPDALAVRRALLESASPPRGGEPGRHLTGALNLNGAIAIISGAAMINATPDLHATVSHPSIPGSPTPAAPGEDEARRGLSPSGADCGCAGGGAGKAAGGGSAKSELVYALGRIGFDYSSANLRDSLVQSGLGNPDDAAALVSYLHANPSAAEEITWTLCLDTLPLYAIKPSGPYAARMYEELCRLLAQQIDPNVRLERVALPGFTSGATVLSSGQAIQQVTPAQRGVVGWKTMDLVQKSLGARPDDVAVFTASGANPGERSTAQVAYDAKATNLNGYLERVYYELRNAGKTPAERAINHSATNAFQAQNVLDATYGSDLQLADISAQANTLGRPGSECWDVTIKFFNPKDRLGQAALVYRFTVDVSGVIPVTLGEPRHWFAY